MSKVCSKVAPCASPPDWNPLPDGLCVTVCCAVSLFVQVTVSPTAISMVWGLKAKFSIATAAAGGRRCGAGSVVIVRVRSVIVVRLVIVRVLICAIVVSAIVELVEVEDVHRDHGGAITVVVQPGSAGLIGVVELGQTDDQIRISEHDAPDIAAGNVVLDGFVTLVDDNRVPSLDNIRERGLNIGLAGFGLDG